MANFEARCASNDPGVTDAAAVREIIGRWYSSGEDQTVEVEGSDDEPVIGFYGCGWPEMVRRPEGAAEDWTPWDAIDFAFDDDLQGFMLEIAPFLKDEWVIQVVGWEKCNFPLSARELVVAPGATEVTVRDFRV